MQAGPIELAGVPGPLARIAQPQLHELGAECVACGQRAARSATVWRLPERAIPTSTSHSNRTSALAAASSAADGSGYFSRSAFQNTTRALAERRRGRRRLRDLDRMQAGHAANAASKLSAWIGAASTACALRQGRRLDPVDGSRHEHAAISATSGVSTSGSLLVI